jgi:hypothetical protein
MFWKLFTFVCFQNSPGDSMSPPDHHEPGRSGRVSEGGGGGGLPISDNNVSTTASDGLLDTSTARGVTDWADIGETDDINVSKFKLDIIIDLPYRLLSHFLDGGCCGNWSRR